ncbi:MAG: NAD(P)-binding domain-containing protein [Candidatus Hadarchaeota archaeon]
MKICLIGLGEIGLPTAKYISKKGHRLQGYDISDGAVKRAKASGVDATTDWAKIISADAYVVCVSTLLKGERPDLSPIFDVCKKISEKSTAGSLVSIESTILPGTCKKLHKNIFKSQLSLIHVPHRYWGKSPGKHGVRQMRVFGAIDEKSMRNGLALYRDSLKIPLHIVPKIEVAEMSKIAENAYRYTQIAFAEELKMVCEEIGLDFDAVREACNTKWNIDIPKAMGGIGGHCLPKDIRYLMSLSKHNIFSKGALAVDEAYRKHLKKIGRKVDHPKFRKI